MTKKIYFMLLSVLLSLTCVTAQIVQTVNVPQAGGLATAIGSNLKTVTDLTLTGTINVTDFQTIKQMTALKNLDMSDVSIVDNALPNNAFKDSEMESLKLPVNLEIIGGEAFSHSSLRDGLVLPGKLKKIGLNSFIYMNVPFLDFSNCSDLEEIGVNPFKGLEVNNNTLDFSKNSKLTRFLNAFWRNEYVGSFYGYTGSVILPENLKEIPSYTFYKFEGTVDLPLSLTKIGNNVFQSSKIKIIDLPSTVTSIGMDAFNNCSELNTIISNNPTPPTLGTNVFYGVDKETTKLEVPSGSINLYGTAAQWKDFLNVKVIVPSKLDLTYKINTGNWKPVGHPDKPDLIIPYKAVRIGEYYWMTQNFNHNETRYFNGAISTGEENIYPMTQAVIDKYLDILDIDKSQYQVDLDKFTRDYGVYYHQVTRQYMQTYAQMYENNSTESNSGWNLPYLKDFRQLISMSDFRHYAPNQDTLTSRDVLYTFGAPYEANDMIKYILTTNCLDHTGTAHTTTDWYGMKYGLINKYGFNLMLGGSRINQVTPGKNEHWFTANCDGSSLDVEWAQSGDLYHLFYTTALAAQDGFFNVHDRVDTNGKEGISYHWQNIRWCRPLSDEELGYKLYININNIEKSSKEWLSLESGDEIPLLLKYRNSNLDRKGVSIIKLGLNESAPEGYIELTHGYIRGFYVNYLLDNLSPKIDLVQVISLACQVDDGTLTGVLSEPIPGANLQVSSQSQTRSLVSDEVAVPFKSDASVSLYPNPVQEVLNISGEGVEKVTIYDMSGRQLSTAKNVNTISVSDLAKGTYLVRVLTAHGESTHKVIKK